MAAVPGCPHCESQQVNRLPVIFTGITGYRCGHCGKVFYEAAGDAARRLAAARATHRRCELRQSDEIARSRTKKGKRATG